MSDVIDFPSRSGPGIGHRTRKNAGGKSTVTREDLLSGDEVKELTALKARLAEFLAKPDILDRDFKAISVEYRAVSAELQAAKHRKEAVALGRRRESSAQSPHSMDGDI